MKKKQLNRWLKRTTAFGLAAAITAGGIVWNTMPDVVLVSEAEELAAGTTDYGLANNIQDGTILHCFDWKYNDIKAELPNIAAAGFTSIQTSPAQRDDTFGVWYMLYQPQSFSITTNALGSKEELQSLCDEAEKYGINVIVDVVANHMRGDGTNVDASMSKSSHADYYHQNDLGAGTAIDWSNRYQVTYGRIGMEDLNSENANVQSAVKAYVQELKSVGVDGIRWDAAKHIGLPSEGTTFWSNVADQSMYNYGEILVGPDDRSSGNEGLMKEYTNYMSVTDSSYSSTVLGSVNSGKVPSTYGNWSARGVSDSKIVYWAESHDTYANDGGESKNVSEDKIDRAYAIVAAKSGATALYFSRPSATAKTAIMAGAKGSTHFTTRAVAMVNKFHNAKVGEKEYYTTDSSCSTAAVCRETGAVVVKGSGSGSVTVPNGNGTTGFTKPGTYVDAVSGNTFTVTASTITGTVGDSGIAVLMGTDYKYGDDNYKGGNGGGSDITVTLPETLEANTVYFVKPSSWSDDVKIYAYSGDGESAAKLTGEWPGTSMTKSTDGYYSYTLPSTVSSAKIIFTDGTNQYPASQQPGLDYASGNAYVYQNSKWTKTEISTPNPNPDPDPDPDPQPSPDPSEGLPETLEANTIYFVKPTGWGSDINIYAYDESGTSTVEYTGKWPGTAMKLSDNGYYYSYTLPSTAKSANIIFNDGKNQYPAQQQTGLTFATGNAYTYVNGTWTKVAVDTPDPKPDPEPTKEKLELTTDAKDNTVSTGSDVKLTSTVNDLANVKYFMYTYTKNDGKEVIIKSYSTAKTVTLNVKKSGSYVFKVYAIDANGNVLSDAVTETITVK